jgi:hypothetical protein
MVAEGDDLSPRWALMRDFADEVNSTGYEYRPISQNSNSFAGGALQRTGFPEDLSNVSFDEFDLWLRRSREKKLITFFGKGALLDSLGLPVPDPMVLQPITPLKSPRVPAGVLFSDSQHLGVSALIMVSLDPGNPKRYDQRIRDRLACDTSKPSPLGTESNGGAITRVFCDTSLLFGDIWLAFAVAKSADASYQDFCRQIQQLTKDADVAALVRGSLEGSKGLYILLPPQCETHR